MAYIACKHEQAVQVGPASRYKMLGKSKGYSANSFANAGEAAFRLRLEMARVFRSSRLRQKLATLLSEVTFGGLYKASSIRHTHIRILCTGTRIGRRVKKDKAEHLLSLSLPRLRLLSSQPAHDISRAVPTGCRLWQRQLGRAVLAAAAASVLGFCKLVAN